MPIADITVHSYDGTKQRVSQDNPFPVTRGRSLDVIRITGTFNINGMNTVIAAPGAANRLVVQYFIIQNESATATTTEIGEDGAGVFRALLQHQGQSISGFFSGGEEWQLPLNSALTVTLDGANQHNYTVGYWVG
jgi:hypothetical protein